MQHCHFCAENETTNAKTYAAPWVLKEHHNVLALNCAEEVKVSFIENLDFYICGNLMLMCM